MIPLRALLYRRGTPVMTLLIIAVNVLCFLYELAHPVYPYNFREAFIARYALTPDRPDPLNFITSMF
ncbi:MAG: rhomboid family intramembrane serine protease, partial [Acidobacteriia bacterium]|nr:rhomboid family intramembrane serine protease [Terriglobia bacterium]